MVLVRDQDGDQRFPLDRIPHPPDRRQERLPGRNSPVEQDLRDPLDPRGRGRHPDHRVPPLLRTHPGIAFCPSLLKQSFAACEKRPAHFASPHRVRSVSRLAPGAVQPRRQRREEIFVCVEKFRPGLADRLRDLIQRPRMQPSVLVHEHGVVFCRLPVRFSNLESGVCLSPQARKGFFPRLPVCVLSRQDDLEPDRPRQRRLRLPLLRRQLRSPGKLRPDPFGLSLLPDPSLRLSGPHRPAVLHKPQPLPHFRVHTLSQSKTNLN